MPHEMTLRPVVYRIPGMDAVAVRQKLAYSGSLTLDLYSPPETDLTEAGSTPRPAVILILGYPDAGVPLFLGCQFREMEFMKCWARLCAASGMIGVVYETSQPSQEAFAVLSFVRENSAGLGIDPNRIGVWSASGNVPVALSVVMQGNIQAAALCYGFTLDLDGSANVARAASQFYFANPTAGRRVEDLPAWTPIFLARAGQDQNEGLNASLDAFAASALRGNLPLTLTNHASGPHAFDTLDDSDASRAVIRGIVEFLKAALKP